MSTKTKQRTFLNWLKDINIFKDHEENVELTSEQKASQARANNIMELSNSPINIPEEKASNKGRISPKINPDTEKAMRKIHNEQIQKESKGRERE